MNTVKIKILKTELNKAHSSICYRDFAKTKMPVLKAERDAIKLIARMRSLRSKFNDKQRKKFMPLYEAAYKAIYFGDEKEAQKAIEKYKVAVKKAIV